MDYSSLNTTSDSIQLLKPLTLDWCAQLNSSQPDIQVQVLFIQVPAVIIRM